MARLARHASPEPATSTAVPASVFATPVTQVLTQGRPGSSARLDDFEVDADRRVRLSCSADSGARGLADAINIAAD